MQQRQMSFDFLDIHDYRVADADERMMPLVRMYNFTSLQSIKVVGALKY